MSNSNVSIRVKRADLRSVAATVAIMGVLFNLPLFMGLPQGEANAAANLVKNGTFETDVARSWRIWKVPESTRTYELYRSSDVPFGYGSYSAAIDAEGSPAEAFSAGLIGNETANNFAVTADTGYRLSFYAKASQPMDVFAYLARTDSNASITGPQSVRIGTDWQQYSLRVVPGVSTAAVAAFVFGDMPDNATLLIDGIVVSTDNVTLATKEVKGYVGAKVSVAANDLTNISASDVAIELPYYDPSGGYMTVKRFAPSSVDSKRAYFYIAPGTFSGIGSLVLYGEKVGDFTYRVSPKIESIFPEQPRADEDLTLTVSGFVPREGNTLVIVNAINNDKKVYEEWVRPHSFDSLLTQLTVHLPMGVVPGKVSLFTAYPGADKEYQDRSNAIAYAVKPVIYNAAWSARGFDQVGDKLLIYGKGIGANPTVNFYDHSGALVERAKGTLKEVGAEDEVIEASVPKKANILTVTVSVGAVESDPAAALDIAARPRLIAIKSVFSRVAPDGKTRIQAAKTGDIITLAGEGFGLGTTTRPTVSFAGSWGRITVPAATVSGGKTVTVAVPAGARSGAVDLTVQGQRSNTLPLELVPTIVEFTPNPAIPGAELRIVARGVGDDLSLTKVFFNLGKANETMVPSQRTYLNGDTAEVHVLTPNNLPAAGTTVTLQYGPWSSDGKATVGAAPRVETAHIDMDTKVLTIRGSGFAAKLTDNLITYKYADADHTVIAPKVKPLSLVSTENGQEIRIQILDEYHYGYVTVTTGGLESNEADFGPVYVKRVVRRVEHVASAGRVMGVLYITGYNFGSEGGVMVGANWADVHYRSNNFIIAVVPQERVNDNPVIVAKP